MNFIDDKPDELSNTTSLQYNGNTLDWGNPFITTEELRKFVREPSEQIVKELQDGQEVPIQPGERHDLRKHHRFGCPPRFRRGDDERLTLELDRLRARFPQLVTGPGSWLEIPEFPLPAELYDASATTLRFAIPPQYPIQAPDDFFVAPPFKFHDGRPLSNVYPAKTPDGFPALRFSWHPTAWRASANIDGGDNLVSFIYAVNLRLRETN